MQRSFDHAKLRAYQSAIRFVAWCDPLLNRLQKSLAAHNQLDRASTSIPLNIVEGNGTFTSSDRCRFFDIARGSALEAAACLDVLVARDLLAEADAAEGKALLIEIVCMLVGLIKNHSDGGRMFETAPGYGAGDYE